MSDPQFPDAMLQRYRGMRIAFFEEIYEKYSQLDFTHPTDRSLGMAGVESRFAKLFGRAQHGLLDQQKNRSYLCRTLLWRRADPNEDMTKIDYPPNMRVLSWSWMAVKGAICFMDIEFGAVDWEQDLGSPFNNYGGVGDAPGALYGHAIDFHKQDNDRVFFDRGREAEWIPSIELKCLILGICDTSDDRLVTHYGLLVTAAEKGSDVFERVGVAAFERDQIWMEQEYMQRICVM